MKYSIEILTMELWALKKRLNNFNNLSDEMMATHPAIEETEKRIKDIEKSINTLEVLK